MKLVVASGKGGTGKTTVATNLAYVASLTERTVAYVDCDVEEPNGHLFLRPQWQIRKPATRPIPQVNAKKCTQCGRCSEVCQYSAIVPLGEMVLVYAEMCHGCGGCALACPAGAITEIPKEIGMVEQGMAGKVQFVRGLLNVGEAISPPLIRQVKEAVSPVDLTVIDAPPGTTCPVIEAVRGADFVLLVTEPTPFGLNDLKLAVEMAQCLGLSLGVVVNRADTGDRQTWEYCRAHRIPILAEIPDDRQIAEAYSRGILATSVSATYQELFRNLLTSLTTIMSSTPLTSSNSKRNAP